MEQNTGICRKPKYTMRWLGLQSLYVLGLAVVLALIANGIDGFASTRVDDGLLKVRAYNMLTQSIAYCFGVIAITLMSLVLVEIVFRKNISRHVPKDVFRRLVCRGMRHDNRAYHAVRQGYHP